MLEEYFDFLAPLDIRVKGTRIGIERVLLDYLEEGLTAEQIAGRYPALALEQVYATILYYLRNKERVCQYLADYLDDSRKRQEEQDRNPSPAVARMRALMAKLDACPPEERREALRRLIAEERAGMDATSRESKAEIV
jgi:uncharacterized protein (DUF433 family)